ncbi:acyl-CoA thioesterase [Paracoccus zhejiangensis]|uniref:Thioesterase n=1 Tax=Paracoccus zhejiangensis TaxID=1077935 RepID=A0A2H5EW23_9RHOB|nr:thioesterase family protein [Paracoccus zhejiangensis]AUH63506.1 thioesterase [Paracoccus zhejiangensis]
MAAARREPPALSDFPLQSFEKLRYSDTDRLGHVNNAVFSTMLETGRVDFLLAGETALNAPGSVFVIARLELDYLAEVTWPGNVDIGTGVLSVGRSSMTLRQALFQHGRCVADATTVLVQMNEETRRPQPLTDAAVTRLNGLTVPQA